MNDILLSQQAKNLSLMMSGARERYGKDSSEYIQKREELRALIKWSFDFAIKAQTDWRTKCSKRIQRNNHHDSWAIRERYVRGRGSWSDYYTPEHLRIWKEYNQK